MPKQLFLQKWDAIYLSSQALKDLFNKHLQPIFLKKGDVLYRENQKIRQIYFIAEGLIVGSRWEGNKKSVCWFLKEQDFIKDHDSLLQHKTAKHTAVAAEDSMLLALNYADLEYINANFPEANIVAKQLLSDYLAYHEQRLSLLTIDNCTERYNSFAKLFPWALKRLKRADIASFLNMSPETLSRIH